MSKEPGEPQVGLALTENGVELTLRARLKGDNTDWDREMAGAWILDIWEKARTLALLQSEYGISVAPEAALPGETPQDRNPEETARVPEAAPETSLETLLQRHEAPPRVDGRQLARWQKQALALLAAADGVKIAALYSLDPTLTRNAVRQRLYTLKDKGLVEFRPTSNNPRVGTWHCMVANGREPTGPEGSQDPVTRLLPQTRGQRWLMLGGHPNLNARKNLEHSFSLAELRWPDLDEADPIEWRLREIARPDVDLVIINRFNRRYSRHYLHAAQAAQAAGKEYLCLTCGYSPQRVATELQRQRQGRERGLVALAA